MKKLLFGIVLILLGGGVFFFIANKPSQGILHKATEDDVKALMGKDASLQDVYTQVKGGNTQQNTGINRYDGIYFSLSFPSSYQIKTAIKNKGLVLEQLIISEPNVLSKTFSVTVTQSSAQSFGDLTDVNFRDKNKNSYKKAPITLGGKTGIVYQSTQDGYEKSAFFLGKGYFFSVVLVSPSAMPLDADFTMLANTIHWKY